MIASPPSGDPGQPATISAAEEFRSGPGKSSGPRRMAARDAIHLSRDAIVTARSATNMILK